MSLIHCPFVEQFIQYSNSSLGLNLNSFNILFCSVPTSNYNSIIEREKTKSYFSFLRQDLIELTIFFISFCSAFLRLFYEIAILLDISKLTLLILRRPVLDKGLRKSGHIATLNTQQICPDGGVLNLTSEWKTTGGEYTVPSKVLVTKKTC